MKQTVIAIAALLCAGTLGYSLKADDNDEPRYGSLGLPENCRAYVQASVSGYRYEQFTAEAAMNGLERNCGINGAAWKNNREQ